MMPPARAPVPAPMSVPDWAFGPPAQLESSAAATSVSDFSRMDFIRLLVFLIRDCIAPRETVKSPGYSAAASGFINRSGLPARGFVLFSVQNSASFGHQ